MAKKVKYLSTKKIKEILSDPFTRSNSGEDYEFLKEDLQEILWAREQLEREKAILRREREMEAEEFENFSLPGIEEIAWILGNFVLLTKEGYYSGFSRT